MACGCNKSPGGQSNHGPLVRSNNTMGPRILDSKGVPIQSNSQKGSENTRSIGIESNTTSMDDIRLIKRLRVYLDKLEKGERPMRNSCLSCALKHLAQSSILLSESVKGYPNHFWFSLGHLAEAEDELVKDFPQMSNMIRDNRVALEKDNKFKIDFDLIIEKISKLKEGGDVKAFSEPIVVKSVEDNGVVIIDGPLPLDIPLSELMEKSKEIAKDGIIKESSVEIIT